MMDSIRIKRNYRKLLEWNFKSYESKKRQLIEQIELLRNDILECEAQMDWCAKERDKLLNNDK